MHRCLEAQHQRLIHLIPSPHPLTHTRTPISPLIAQVLSEAGKAGGSSHLSSSHMPPSSGRAAAAPVLFFLLRHGKQRRRPQNLLPRKMPQRKKGKKIKHLDAPWPVGRGNRDRQESHTRTSGVGDWPVGESRCVAATNEAGVSTSWGRGVEGGQGGMRGCEGGVTIGSRDSKHHPIRLYAFCCAVCVEGQQEGPAVKQDVWGGVWGRGAGSGR